MEKQEKFTLIIGLIAVIAMGLFLGSHSAPVTENVTGNDGENYEVFYVPCEVTRGVDYIEVEYYGNVYSAWIEPESEIQTGDYVWAGFYIYNNELELVDFRFAYAFH